MADDGEVPAWLRGGEEEESCVGAYAQAFLRRVPLVGDAGVTFSVSLPPSLWLCLCWECCR